MKNENLPNIEKEKPRAWIVYGGSGHVGEYVVSLEGCGIDNPVPHKLVQQLKEKIGDDRDVLNRGSRIEIIGEKDSKVVEAVRDVLEEEYAIIVE